MRRGSASASIPIKREARRGGNPRRAQESKFLPKGYPMNTSDVLNRAADLIEERGWATGPMGWGDFDPESGLCLEGGIAAAVGICALPSSGMVDTRTLAQCPAYGAVVAHLGAVESLWMWNDHPDRTAAEVIEVLRAAALIEAAREDQEAAWATYAELVSA